MIALLIVCYIATWVTAAMLLYPFMVDQLMSDPETAAAFFGLFWPLILALAVAIFPFWLIGRIVHKVHA